MTIKHSRRNFLQKITVSAVALPFLPSYNPESLYTKPYQGSALRVAIMGLGSYGARVAEAMQSSKMAKLTGVISGTLLKSKNGKANIKLPKRTVTTTRILTR